MIVIWTPVHGWLDVVEDSFASVDKYMPAPFIHYLMDDFSEIVNPEHCERYKALAGPVMRDGGEVGQRIYLHLNGTNVPRPPNVGHSLLHMFNIFRTQYTDAEALLCLFCNTLLREGTIPAFREAQAALGAKAGAITSLMTRYKETAANPEGDDNILFGYGGVREESDYMGVHRGMEIGSWDPNWPNSPMRWAALPWTHLAILYLANSTMMRREIKPDPQWKHYWCDHDICKQIQAAGMDIVVTDHAVATRQYGAKSSEISPLYASTEERVAYHNRTYEDFKRKWGM